MADHLLETFIAKKDIYHGKIINLRLDTVKLPNGKEATREVVEHPGAVAIIAGTTADKVLLVTQYRHPIGQLALELPAGKLEPGEPVETAAYRELREETGYQATHLKHVHTFYTSPGFSDEIMYLYAAKGIVFEKMAPDEDEFIDCKEYSRKEILELVHNGTIKDSKTLIGLYWWLYESNHDK